MPIFNDCAVLRQDAQDVADGDRLGDRVVGLGLPPGHGGHVERRADDLVDHLCDGGHLGMIQGLGDVLRGVIAGILAGREEEERDAAAAEGAVVAPIEHEEVGSEQVDRQATALAGLLDPGRKPGACSVPMTKT